MAEDTSTGIMLRLTYTGPPTIDQVLERTQGDLGCTEADAQDWLIAGRIQVTVENAQGPRPGRLVSSSPNGRRAPVNLAERVLVAANAPLAVEVIQRLLHRPGVVVATDRFDYWKNGLALRLIDGGSHVKLWNWKLWNWRDRGVQGVGLDGLHAQVVIFDQVDLTEPALQEVVEITNQAMPWLWLAIPAE